MHTQLINFCFQKTNHKVDQEISSGADGIVFSLKHDDKKVIKYCILYEYNQNIHAQYKQIEKVLSYIHYNKPDVCAYVYEHQYLCSDFRDTIYGKQEYILHYYVMEKLNKLSEDEKKVFHSLICNEDRNLIKNYSDEKIQKIISGLSRGLDFDQARVKLFLSKLKNTPIMQKDLNVRNVMKNDEGNFLLIDFDRCELNIYN